MKTDRNELDNMTVLVKIFKGFYYIRYVVKTFKNLHQNQLFDCLESWLVALSTQVLPRCSNDDIGLTLTLLCVKVRYGKCLYTRLHGMF